MSEHGNKRLATDFDTQFIQRKKHRKEAQNEGRPLKAAKKFDYLATRPDPGSEIGNSEGISLATRSITHYKVQFRNKPQRRGHPEPNQALISAYLRPKVIVNIKNDINKAKACFFNSLTTAKI